MGFIADVFDVTLIDPVSGDVIATTTLQDASIDVKVTENEIRGGKGNTLLGTLHVSRDISVTMNDVSFRYDFLAKQLGQDVQTGAGVAYCAPKYYTVTGTTTLTITLDKTPSDSNSLAIYDKNGVKLSSSAYTVSASTVTFTSGAVAGDNVEVRTYTYATDAKTQTIEFDSAVFAKGLKAVLTTVEVEGDESISHTIQYIFDNCVCDGNFQVQTKSQKEAAVQGFAMKVIKPTTTTVVGRMLRIPYVA